jgi:Ca-activated chloride channel family protein
MRFSDPVYLWLVPLLFAFIWWSGRRLLGISRSRRRLVLLLRSTVVLLIVLALAGWQGINPNRGTCTIFVIDTSESVPDKGKHLAEAYVRDALKSIGGNDLAGLIIFGQDALIDMNPTYTRILQPIYSSPDKQGTDIASAIRLASALFPDGYARRIVLLSDGNETQGEAVNAARVAATDHISIDTVLLDSKTVRQEILISRMDTPNEAKIGEPFDVRVVVESQGNAQGTLLIDREGVPLKSLPVQLTPGKNVVVATLKMEKTGIHRLRATLEALPDTDGRNNVGMGLVSVRGKPRVLLAEGRSGSSNTLANALRANKLEVVQVSGDRFPSRIEELQTYDAILFSDFSALSLSGQQIQAVESAVKNTGVGFVMIGGQQSFLNGGYYGTPIADALPVDLEIKNRKVQYASTVIIIIDASGSMNDQTGGTKNVLLAASAAAGTLKILKPMDRFGVVSSSHGSDWLTPDMANRTTDPFGCDGRVFKGCHGVRAGQPAAAIYPVDQREKIIQVLQRVHGTGAGIFVRGSLEMAERGMLSEQPNRSRHIIMLADASDCDEKEGSLDVVNRLRAMGVTVSVVAFGNGQELGFLKALTQAGGGQFHLTRSAGDLTRIFTSDVSTMTRSAIEEGAFLPKVAAGEETVQGIDWDGVRPLLAYNLTSERPMAKTLMRTQKEDPLLAVWQYGLGTSIAFTSDAQPKWAQQWIGWSEFAPFWTQVVRTALRKSSRTRYSLTAYAHQGQGFVELQAFTPEGEPLNLLQPEVQVATPDGKGVKLTLQQKGSGKYEGRFPLSGLGTYMLTAHQPGQDGKPEVFTTGFAVPYPTEYQFTRPNAGLLQQIAETTRGQVNPKPDTVFRPVPNPGSVMTEMWPLLLVLALTLFLFDVTVRRIALGIPEAVSLFIRHLLGARLKHRPSTRPAEAVSRLQAAKSRARIQTASSTATSPVIDGHRQPAPAPVVVNPSSPQNEPVEAKASPEAKPTLARLLEAKKQKREE